MDILIVEDDDTILSTYIELIEDLGLEYLHCRNSKEIMSLISNMPQFKIGIFDINIGCEPLDGKTLLKTMRLKGFQFTPIIISGMISSTDISNFCEENIKYVIRKPANPLLLSNLLKELSGKFNESVKA